MRIPKSWVRVLAREILSDLLGKEDITLKVSEEHASIILEELIRDELMAEDRLNAEVREILKKFDSEIEKGRLDYRKLFEMTKKKLIRERNIIL